MPFKRFPQISPPFLEALRDNADGAWIRRLVRSGEKFEICIVGGGPAGSFLAALLASGAEAMTPEAEHGRLAGLFRIRVFEPRDASVTRRRGCGLGSGVFIAEDFRDIGLAALLLEHGAPVHPIHMFHHVSPAGEFTLDLREEFPSCTLYATNRSSSSDGPSLDLVMRRKLESHRLVEFIPDMVTGIERSGGRFHVTSADTDGVRREWRADFLAGAHGANPKTAELFGAVMPSYRPPVIKRMIQREARLTGPDAVKARNTICVFSLPTPDRDDFSIHFLALTPKTGEDDEEIMTATIRYALKRPGVRINPVEVFSYAIGHPLVRRAFPRITADDLDCVCAPFAVIAQGESVVDDGCAALGDAGLAPRLYKNGLSGAYISARMLAETLLLDGPGKNALKSGFENRMRRRFNWRNRLGMITMNVYDRLNLRWGAFGPVMGELISSREGRRAIAAISTGVLTYPDIFVKFMKAGVRGALRSLFARRLGFSDALRLAAVTIGSRPWRFRSEGEELVDDDFCADPAPGSVSGFDRYR